MRAGVVAILLGAAFLLSGCQYLLGFANPMPPIMPGESFDPGAWPSFDPDEYGSFDPNDPGFSLPPPLATYTTGSAAITIAGTKSTLDRLSSPGVLYPDFGTEAGWTDGHGLYVKFYGTTQPGLPTGDGFVTIDRIADGQHWTSADPGVCAVTVTQGDSKGLVGTASCKGLRWADAMATPLGMGPSPVAGEPAFDAEITFTAVP